MSHGIYSIHQYLKPSPFLGKTSIVVTGVVIDIPHATDQGLSFLLKTQEGILKLNWYQQKLTLTPGQVWQLKIRLKALPYFANPGEFNYGEYLHQEGIVAVGYVLEDNADQLETFAWANAPLDYLRFCWYQRLLTTTAELKTQAVLIALILGDKTLLNPIDSEAFERTGTSYFMVISGLHIVLFAMLGALFMRYLWALCPRLALKIPATQVALATGLILGLVYGLMAGAVVPTQRAVLMLLFMGVAKLFFRRISSWRALLLSFFLVLLWNPLVIFSVAFWMSFIAVFFLIFCFSGRVGKLKLWQEWIWPQWLMFCVLMPLTIYTFNQLSVISIFTNLLAMPVMMLGVIPLALLGAFLLWIMPVLGVWCFVASNFLMQHLLSILQYFAFKDWWGDWVAQISFANMMLGLLGMMIVFLPKGIPGRWLGWFMVIPVLLPFTSPVPEGQIQSVQLQTSNGPVNIVRTSGHVIVEERITNIRSAHGDLRHIIEAYLMHEGIHQIDLWVLSTQAGYHQVLGLMQDLPKVRIMQIAINHHFSIYDSRLTACAKAEPWVWDGVTFALREESKQCYLVMPFLLHKKYFNV